MNDTNVKWHQLSPEDALRTQQSNTALGLSLKAARSRFRRQGANTLFDHSFVGFHAWKTLLADPSLWLALSAVLLCLCFSEIFAGILSGILWLAAMTFCGALIARNRRLSARISLHRIPEVTVLREGKRYRLTAREVVPGDVLLLREGDIVPADCRLLSTSAAFRVLTLYPDKDGKTVKKLLPKNAATVYPYKAQQFAPFFENMIYGKSEVLAGECRALVVETGYRTFWGAMTLYTGADGREEPERCADAVTPYLRVYALLSYVLILPLLLIGFFTAPKDTSLLRIVAPTFALLAGSSKGILTLLFRSISRHNAEEIFECTPPENRAILKGRDADERLSGITDLIVLGRYASSDGHAHLFRCALGTGEIAVGGPQPLLSSVSRAYWLLSEARKTLPVASAGEVEDSEDLATTLSELLALCPIDADAERIRIRSSQLAENADGTRILEVKASDGGYRLIFSKGEGMIHHCTAYEGANGRIHPLSETQQEALHLFAISAREEGARIVTVLSQSYGRSVLLGVLALREQMQAVLPSALEELRQCGVRVSFFFDESWRDARAYANAAGLPRAIAPEGKLPEEPTELLKYYAKYRVFAGIQRDQITTLIQTLRRARCKVAVLGADVQDRGVLSVASFVIAPEPWNGGERRREGELPDPIDGRLDPARAAQAVRSHADLLISRTGPIAGGIPAILQALSYTRSTKLRARLLLRYFACSHLLRWGFTALSLLLGIGLMNSAQLLFLGLGVDLMAYVWILRLPILQSRLRKRTPFDRETVPKCLTDRTLIAAPISVMILIGGTTVLLGRFGIISNAVAVSSLFISLLLCQTTLLYLNAFRSGFPAVGRIWLLPVIPVLFIAMVLLASVLQGAVASVTEIGAWNLIGGILSVLAPLLLLLLTSLFSRIGTKSTK